MKNLRLLKRLLFAIVAFLLSTTASFAHEFEVDGIYYNILSSTEKTVEVTYQGRYYDSYSNEYTGSVTIPETVTYSGKTYFVTSIGSSAFRDCSGLSEVTIPNSVTSFGLCAFKDCPGLKNTSKYEIVGEGGGNTGGGGDTPSTGDGNGSYESPFYPANVIALNPQSTTEAAAGGAGVWVKGFIVGHMPSTNTLLENTVFDVSSDVKTNIVLAPTAGCKDYTQCISVHLPSGDVRTALNLYTNPGNLGAEVLLYGDVMKYCGAPGLKNTSKYEIVGEGGGNTGGGDDTPSIGGNTIYEGLISHCDDWTFDNVNLPEAATYIWSWKEYNGSYYLNASAYVGGAAHASEAYAYTTLDLTGKSSASLTFDHAAKFQTSLKELCAVVVRVQGTTAWTALTMPTWPEAGTWTFVNCGSISLNAYAGKKIEIGFRYGSRDGGADTWEIKNFIVTGHNLFYKNVSETEVWVTKSKYEPYSGDIIIPEKVTFSGINYTVTGIEDGAFSHCENLSSITIPNSVTSIGTYAFQGCSGLTEVTIPNSVTSIGNYAFLGCSGLTSIRVESGNSNYDSRDNCNAIIETETNTLIAGCQNTVIPGSITSIGDYAFFSCSGLTSVTIPNSVTSIGDWAFSDCSGLTEVVIPNSVTSIGDYAFSGCSELTSVTIPNSVTSIGDWAFSGCSGLTSVTIPNSVTSISDYAFYGCSGLTSVTIGNSVTSIGYSAFEGCSGLTSVTIPNSVTSIGYAAFRGCSGLTSVTIGNSVTSIGTHAFYDTGWYNNQADGILYLDNCCLGYKGDSPTGEISLKEGTRLIGNYAFRNCSGLTSITIPNSVTSIGGDAFSGCSGLTSVTIPNSVTSIGDWAFSDCSGLTEVVIPNSVTSIGTAAFYECSGLTKVTIGNSVTSIGEYAFRYCTKLYQVINLSKLTLTKGSTNHGYVTYYASIIINVPNGIINGDFVWSISEEDDVNILVRYLGAASELILPDDYNGENYVIGNYAFNNCSGLTEVTIPNSVTEIGDEAFYGCSGLTQLIIADGIEALSLGNNGSTNGLFYDCPLEKLYLGRNLSYDTGFYYDYSPFYNKTTLKEVTIGNFVTSIGDYAFYNCSGLTSITIGPGVLSIGENTFYNSNIKKVIWLTNTPPQGYETVAGEVNYVANNRYSDLSNVTIYPYLSSLFEVDGIKYVPVSPSERTCDALDCSYETSISDINIGKTVSFMGIEMNIKAVKPYTFYDNTNITKSTIDSEFNGSIGDYAFAYCNKIDEIILPDGVTSLGGSAFEGCSSLASVEIGSGIPALNDNAFYGCTPLSKITIPANVTSIGNNVFDNCTSLAELTITDRDTELSLGSNGSNPLFSDCPLKSVYIGGNITYPTSSGKGYSPFYRNTSLETVVITDKETEISENEFYGCTALKTVSMGDGVETIGDWAFSGCSSLDSFSFGSGMKTIGTEAFSDCTAMTKLYSNAIVPPTCGSQALDDINKWNCELYVPQASITKYQIADQWKEFFFIKDIESGIEDVYVEEVAVTVEDGKIVVKNATGIVTVYNITGIAVATETADGNEVRFDNLQPGVYIVVVNNKSVKVVL